MPKASEWLPAAKAASGIRSKPDIATQASVPGAPALAAPERMAIRSTRSGCSGARPGDLIRLKLLLIAGQKHDTNLDAMRTILNQIGVPYDILIAATETLTDERLWHGNHAHYQGIILATSSLGEWNEVLHCWESGFDATEWQTLWRYAARFGVRQATLCTQPGAPPEDYGLTLAGSVNTTDTPLDLYLTEEGRRIFWYLNQANPVAVRLAWTYLTHPLDPATVPLLLAPDGQTVGALRTCDDGREQLALSMAHNPHLTHTWLLGYGLVNWVTRGLFLGQRHVYLSIQVDDIFNSNHLWDVETQVEETGPPYRLNRADIDALLQWLNRLQRKVRNAEELTLDMAYNGAGATRGVAEDGLVERLLQEQARFRWINHGYTHLLLDQTDYADSYTEIRRNHETALSLGLFRYDPDSMVTADVSGLQNGDFLRAAKDAGIRFLVSDTSRAGWENPAPNVGIVSAHQPEILLIPRHANNLFYDVSRPAEWVSKYNHIYGNYWCHQASFEEILEQEARTILRYLLRWDIDPLMFHQANLRAYDGTHSLLSDLIDHVLAHYNALMGDVPILCLSMHALGEQMALRSIYNAATIHAHLIQGQGLVLLSDRAVSLPLTGAAVGPDSESYAGQSISRIVLKAHELHWIPLTDLVGYESATTMETVL